MASIPVVEGFCAKPYFPPRTQLPPDLIPPVPPEPLPETPDDGTAANAYEGVQSIQADGDVDREARFVAARPIAADLNLVILGEVQSAFNGQPMARAVTIANIATSSSDPDVIVSYAGGTINGVATLRIPPGTSRTLRSSPVSVGQPIVNFVINNQVATASVVTDGAGGISLVAGLDQGFSSVSISGVGAFDILYDTPRVPGFGVATAQAPVAAGSGFAVFTPTLGTGGTVIVRDAGGGLVDLATTIVVVQLMVGP